MTCPECGSQPQQSAAFCTECGADLLSGRGTTVSDTAPVHPLREPSAHPRTPVREMVGSERAAWIDSVWGSTAGDER